MSYRKETRGAEKYKQFIGNKAEVLFPDANVVDRPEVRHPSWAGAEVRKECLQGKRSRVEIDCQYPSTSNSHSKTTSRRRRGSSKPTRILRDCLLPWCETKTRDCKKHMVGQHLPRIMNPFHPLSEELTRARYAFLVTLVKASLGTSKTLEDAVDMINLSQLIPAGAVVTREMADAMKDMCRVFGLAVPEFFQVQPLNSMAALFHWRCVVVLLQRLSKDVCEGLQRSHQEVLPSTTGVRSPPPVRHWDDEPMPAQDEDRMTVLQGFDAHFHLDRLKSSICMLGDITLQSIEEQMPVTRDYLFYVSGAVAVYSDPTSYPAVEELDRLKNNNMMAAIGIHPKNPYTDTQFETMSRLLLHDNVVGLGDVGLDFSVPVAEWYPQRNKLLHCLEYLDPNKVLILHLRGTGGDDLFHNGYCLDLLRYVAYISPTQKIQLHSFSGDPSVVRMWRQYYPEARFSISGLAKNFNQSQQDGLRSIPLDKLLLETDAPYLSLKEGRHTNAPHFLDEVAQLVVSMRGDSTLEEVLESTKRGAQAFFGI